MKKVLMILMPVVLIVFSGVVYAQSLHKSPACATCSTGRPINFIGGQCTGFLDVTGDIAYDVDKNPPSNRHGKMPPRYGKGRKGRFMGISNGFFLGGRIKQELNLTDDQVKQLQLIKEEHLKKTAGMRDEIKTLMEEMRNISAAGINVDVNALITQMEKISKVRLSLQAERLRSFEKARNILTDEQKTKLQEFMQKAKQHHIECSCSRGLKISE